LDRLEQRLSSVGLVGTKELGTQTKEFHIKFGFDSDLMNLFDQIPIMPWYKFAYHYHFSVLKRLTWSQRGSAKILGLGLRTIKNRVAEMKVLKYPIEKNPRRLRLKLKV
jgi:hypothetical protein